MGQGRKKQLNSAGQTLIETLAAVFILAMGMTAAVGLAIYALNSSGGIVKQIIATGIAREGLEEIRNMRDTNWLNDTLNTGGCYNFSTNQAGSASCYTNWLNKTYCLEPTAGVAACGTSPVASTNNIIGFDSSVPALYVKYRSTATNFQGYGLIFDPTNSGTTGFYSDNPSGPGLPCQDGANAGGHTISDYCRKIIITKNPPGITANAFLKDPNLSLVLVQSQVWWVDKNCPRVADFTSASVTCRLELDTYLTNWKNY